MDIVLVHSGVTDSREWDRVRPLLERRHRVQTPELPGFGNRPLEPGEHSLADTVLELEFERAALVGTSHGARAVLEAALEAPNRVASLVLVSPNPFGWSPEVRAIGAEEEALFEGGDFDAAAELMVRAWLVSPRRDVDDVDPALRALVHSAQRRAYELDQGGDASHRRVEIEPARIRCPTLLVRGALDFDDVERACVRFLAELPDAREVVFDDCAHLPTLEQPERFAAAVLEFLEATS
jgi:pimeloyl-ACP methyl ester carboxylesterase